jgi:hypothetical protein
MVREYFAVHWRTLVWTVVILGATLLLASMVGRADYIEPH